jgi:hypothetical protein
MDKMIECKILVKFPLEPNEYGVCYTKESLKDIGSHLENLPIVSYDDGNENVIGVLSDSYVLNENENEIECVFDAKLFNIKGNPQISVYQVAKNEDGTKTIKSFSLSAISISK